MRTCLLALSIILLAGCTTISPPPQIEMPSATLQPVQWPSVTLPTAIAPTEIRPTNTLVMAEAWTPTPIPSATPLPDETLGLVVDVHSAETVEVVLEGDLLQKTYIVRLIGVDAPDNTPVEPWGQVAHLTLNSWLRGKIVRLVQDTTEINDANELPRYLYLGESFINLKLIELGLARADTTAPDLTMSTQLKIAADAAQAANIGLWGPPPTATPTQTPTPNLTLTLTPQLTGTAVITSTSVFTVTPAITATPTGGSL